MNNILKNFHILNIPVDDNPFITLNFLVANCKYISYSHEISEETLCVGILDNTIIEKDIRIFFSKFGKIKSYNVLLQKNLSPNFKMFAFCIYIIYEENYVIKNIISHSVPIYNYFKCESQAPYVINLKKENYLHNVKKYYDHNYNFDNGRKTIINDIINLNKGTKRKKKLHTIDEDGFTIVQGRKENTEFINSIYSQKSEKVNYFKKKKNKTTPENFYIFRKKNDIENANNVFLRKRINKNAIRKEKRQKKISKRY